MPILSPLSNRLEPLGASAATTPIFWHGFDFVALASFFTSPRLTSSHSFFIQWLSSQFPEAALALFDSKFSLLAHDGLTYSVEGLLRNPQSCLFQQLPKISPPPGFTALNECPIEERQQLEMIEHAVSVPLRGLPFHLIFWFADAPINQQAQLIDAAQIGSYFLEATFNVPFYSQRRANILALAQGRRISFPEAVLSDFLEWQTLHP